MNVPVTTTFGIEGYRIVEYRGLVRGIVVRALTIKQGFIGGLKTFVGGNIAEYAQMCEQARSDAFNLMVKNAMDAGANAIVGVRYESSDVGSSTSSATEVLCYGTAVVIEKE